MAQLTNGKESIYPSAYFDAKAIVPNALLLSTTTFGGNVEGDTPALRVAVTKKDGTSTFVKEGNKIGESEPELDELVIHTAKLAQMFRQTNESASYNTPNQLFHASLLKSIVAAADSAFLTNQPDEGDEWQPTGLTVRTDITTGTQWTGTGVDVFDAISDAIVTIQADGGTPTHIILSPKTWGGIRKITTANSTYQLGNPGEAVDLSVWGVPVVVNPSMNDTDILVLDKAAVIAAHGQIRFSKHDAFEYDSVIWRTTWRIGWGILYPQRVVKLTKTAGK